MSDLKLIQNVTPVIVELTPELKEKFKIVCGHFIDECKKNGLSPIESYSALSFITSSLEELMGMKTHGVIHINEG